MMSITTLKRPIWGDTGHQGSLEIAAPEALYAVGFGRKLQKNPSRASVGFAGRPRFGYTIDEDGEREREETNCPLKRVRSKCRGIH
jgi:hypothetical protein